MRLVRLFPGSLRVKDGGRKRAFHVYRNGELVFTGRETEERYVLEADGERVDAMRFACAPGDHMLLTYTCEDAFGLRYEFPIKGAGGSCLGRYA